jgi:FtsH-binding integral membrane protein
VRKVYLILFTQLGLTAILCAISMTSLRFLYWQFNNWWFMFMMMGIGMFVCIALICIPSLARRVPINYILLTTYTLCIGFMVSSICGMTAANV